MLGEAYGNVVNDIALIIARSGVSRDVEDDEYCNLGDILLSRITDVCVRPRVDLTATQSDVASGS